MKGKIKYDGDLIRYFDVNNIELKEGDTVRFADGSERKLYLTENNELGTDATNPLWIKMGRAVECEYGIYPLDEEDIKGIEKIA